MPRAGATAQDSRPPPMMHPLYTSGPMAGTANWRRMYRSAVTHAPGRKNACAGRMMRRKRTSRAVDVASKPGAATRANSGANHHAAPVSRQMARVIHQNAAAKNRHPSSGSRSKRSDSSGMRVMEK